MLKDKVVIWVIAIIVVSAILFGVIMAYRTYKLPMTVDNIDEAVAFLKNNSYENEIFLMEKFAMFNELSRSCKMKDKNTGKIRKFTKEEMEEIGSLIGGKDVIIEYLHNITDEKEKREKTRVCSLYIKNNYTNRII